MHGKDACSSMSFNVSNETNLNYDFIDISYELRFGNVVKTVLLVH